MKTSPSESRTQRLLTLDGLRGIAALSVLIFHYTTVFPRFFGAALPSPLTFETGAYGVHLFFIISGFVILMSLEHSKGRGFVRSRFLRLFPVFWASLVMTGLVLSFSSWYSFSPSTLDILANFLMAHDYLKRDPFDGVYWSLTYELGLYFFLYMIFRLRREQIVPWLPAYMAMGTLAFHFLSALIPHPVHLLLVFNKYGYLFGCGIALYLIKHQGWKVQWALVLIAAPILGFFNDGISGSIAISVIVATASWAVLVPGQASLLTSPVLLFFGTISYALYLTHQMIGYEVLARLQTAGWSWAMSVIATTVLMIGLAAALTYGIERPVARRFKRRRSY